MAILHSVEIGFPKHYYSQEDLFDELSFHWRDKFHNIERVKKFHQNVQVKGRHLALPISDYAQLDSFQKKNDKFIELALPLIQDTVTRCLESSGINIDTIGAIFSNTVTGLAVPALDALLCQEIPFRSDIKRNPLFGLGCLAGMGGINRACDYLKAYPEQAALFFSIELCSLTIQLQDVSIENIVSSGLFGDGAGVVLLLGEEHPLASQGKLQWLGPHAYLSRGTTHYMGWEFRDTGLKVVLSPEVPRFTQEKFPKFIEQTCHKLGVASSDIGHYIGHPGGPKVLSAVEEAMGLENDELKSSWDSLQENGNMSSVSILDVFSRHLKQNKKSNQLALGFAMGPGFSIEAGAFKWI